MHQSEENKENYRNERHSASSISLSESFQSYTHQEQEQYVSFSTEPYNWENQPNQVFANEQYFHPQEYPYGVPYQYQQSLAKYLQHPHSPFYEGNNILAFSYGYNNDLAQIQQPHQVYQPYPLSRELDKNEPVIEDVRHQRRYFCGLFNSKRRLFQCLVLSLLLGALSITLLLFFCWPRSPLLYINPLQDYTALHSSGKIQQGNYQSSFQMVANFTTTSSNYIDYRIHQMDVSGAIVTPDSSGNSQMANIIGNRRGLVMKSHGTSSFGLILTFSYQSEGILRKKSDVASKAPILFAWGMSCNASGFGYQEYPNHSPGDIEIVLTASMSYDPFSFIPISSTMITQFRCTSNMVKMLNEILVELS